MTSATGYTGTERRNGQRTAIITGLTAAGGTGALLLARRARRRRKSPGERAQAMAKKLPNRARRLPSQARDVSRRWTKDVGARMGKVEEQQWRMWGIAAVVVTWMLLRMAEVRQLRKMNRVLISRA
jgi:hypothetical protein